MVVVAPGKKKRGQKTCNKPSIDGTLCRTKIHRPEIFLSPEPEVTCGTVAIIIGVVLLSPYLRIRGVSLSSNHYNQSHRVYINRRLAS